MTRPYFFALVLGIFLASIAQGIQGVDQSLEEDAKGKNVVELVVDKIQKSLIFEDDYGFLRRIAYVETKDGEEKQAYPIPNYGGLWNIAEVQYIKTKDSSLNEAYGHINTQFGINWNQTSWKDLLKPLYSGLAARLFLQILTPQLPQTLGEQAEFWDQQYSRHDLWDNHTFINRTDEFDELNPPCSGKMDLVIILDGSGSVGVDNFQLCRQFAADLIGSYSLRGVRHGFVLFASEEDTRIVFELDNYKSMDELKQEVLQLPYPDSKTATNVALERAYEIFTKSEPRQGSPRVVTIFTDGASNPQGVDKIALLKALNVSSYVVGVTDSINYEELTELAYGLKANVFTLSNFVALSEFYRRLNEETCRVPQKPALNDPVRDDLNRGEKRYFSFEVPEDGITISLGVIEGQLQGYYSLSSSNPNPSSAFHDGILAAEGTFFEPSVTNIFAEGIVQVYLSVEGLSSNNSYVIEAMEGYFVSSTESSEGTSTDESDDTTETDEADDPTTIKPTTATEGALNAAVTGALLIGAIVSSKILNL